MKLWIAAIAMILITTRLLQNTKTVEPRLLFAPSDVESVPINTGLVRETSKLAGLFARRPIAR